GADGAGSDIVLLCVPDREIASAARAVAPREDLLVGHCSGATGLGVLAPHESFGLHPLMTITHGGGSFDGAACAVAGTTLRAVETARSLGAVLTMRPFAIADEDRAAYHAAASIASNFLVTLEAAAEQLAATAGVPREALAPLVRAAVEDWAALGAGEALTGPIARGDDAGVARQRMGAAARPPAPAGPLDPPPPPTRARARSHAPPRR